MSICTHAPCIGLTLFLIRLPPQIARKGRGLLSTGRVEAGSTVFREQPFVYAHVDSSVASTAWDSLGADYHPSVRLPAARRLDTQYAAAARQHPRLALRIAGRILADIADAPSGRAARTWGAVRQLCRAGIPAPPPEWAADLRSIRAVLTGEPADGTAAAAAAAASKVEAEVAGDGAGEEADARLFDALFTDAWSCLPPPLFLSSSHVAAIHLPPLRRRRRRRRRRESRGRTQLPERSEMAGSRPARPGRPLPGTGVHALQQCMPYCVRALFHAFLR